MDCVAVDVPIVPEIDTARLFVAPPSASQVRPVMDRAPEIAPLNCKVGVEPPGEAVCAGELAGPGPPPAGRVAVGSLELDSLLQAASGSSRAQIRTPGSSLVT